MPKLSIDVQARTAQFQDGIDKVKKQSGGLVRDLERGFGDLRSSFAALGGVAIFGGLVSGIKSVTNELDGLAKVAQGAGVTVEQLSALRFAADFAGVATNDLDKSLSDLAQRLEQAKEGTGEAVSAFKQLKIDPNQFTSSADLLSTLADRFQQLPDGANKTSLAMRLFGESGARLIPFLNAGSAGMEQMREEAERLGLIIDTETAQAAERLNDNLNRVSKGIDGLKVALAGPVIEHLAEFSEQMRTLSKLDIGFLDRFAEASLTESEVSDVIETLSRDLAELEKRKSALEETLRQPGEEDFLGVTRQALKNTNIEIESVNAQLDRLIQRRFQPPGRPPVNPAVSNFTASEARSKSEAISAEEKLLSRLKERLIAAQDLNEVQRVGIALASGNFNSENARAAISLAEQIDGRRRLNVELQAQADLNNLIARAEAAAAAELDGVAERALNLADPFRQTAIEIEKIQLAAKEGLIPDEVANKAINSLKKVEDQAKNVKETLERSDEISKEFWLSFQSGAEDAIFEGEKLSDVLKSLAEDIARLALRQSIGNLVNKFTNPEQAADKGSQPPSSVTNGATAGANNVIKAKAVPAGGGGITVNNYNTVHGSGGVTRGDLAVASKQTEKSTLAAIADQQKRGI